MKTIALAIFLMLSTYAFPVAAADEPSCDTFDAEFVDGLPRTATVAARPAIGGVWRLTNTTWNCANTAYATVQVDGEPQENADAGGTQTLDSSGAVYISRTHDSPPLNPGPHETRVILYNSAGLAKLDTTFTFLTTGPLLPSADRNFTGSHGSHEIDTPDSVRLCASVACLGPFENPAPAHAEFDANLSGSRIETNDRETPLDPIAPPAVPLVICPGGCWTPGHPIISLPSTSLTGAIEIGDTRIPLDIHALPPTGTYTISGRLFDGDGLAAQSLGLPGTVVATGTSEDCLETAVAQADVTGAYTLDLPCAGEYSLSARPLDQLLTHWGSATSSATVTEEAPAVVEDIGFSRTNGALTMFITSQCTDVDPSPIDSATDVPPQRCGAGIARIPSMHWGAYTITVTGGQTGLVPTPVFVQPNTENQATVVG